jgi:hypothetical protein
MTEELNTRARESGHPSQYRRSAGRRSKLRCFRGLFADEFVDHTPPAKHHVWKFVRRSTMAVRAGSANQFLNK